ncbi:hypothetical protein IKF87_01080 [Candidatus Saccharibacteria bacterium]|nr:hypothetical protein [Candidatus Saccharibacteria bacterium]
MAKYEDMGYCPKDSIEMRVMKLIDEEDIYIRATGILETLGKRLGIMVYDDRKQTAYGRTSIGDFLINDEEAPKVAQLLRWLIPDDRCEDGEAIKIRDVLSPYAFEDVYHLEGKKWSFTNRKGELNVFHPIMRKKNKYLFTSDNFIVVIEDNMDEDLSVIISIFTYSN